MQLASGRGRWCWWGPGGIIATSDFRACFIVLGGCSAKSCLLLLSPVVVIMCALQCTERNVNRYYNLLDSIRHLIKCKNRHFSVSALAFRAEKRVLFVCALSRAIFKSILFTFYAANTEATNTHGHFPLHLPLPHHSMPPSIFFLECSSDRVRCIVVCLTTFLWFGTHPKTHGANKRNRTRVLCSVLFWWLLLVVRWANCKLYFS